MVTTLPEQHQIIELPLSQLLSPLFERRLCAEAKGALEVIRIEETFQALIVVIETNVFQSMHERVDSHIGDTKHVAALDKDPTSAILLTKELPITKDHGCTHNGLVVGPLCDSVGTFLPTGVNM